MRSNNKAVASLFMVACWYPCERWLPVASCCMLHTRDSYLRTLGSGFLNRKAAMSSSFHGLYFTWMSYYHCKSIHICCNLNWTWCSGFLNICRLAANQSMSHFLSVRAGLSFCLISDQYMVKNRPRKCTWFMLIGLGTNWMLFIRSE